MTMTLKTLADGQLGVAKATLYTCPASTQTIIKTMSFVNTHVAGITMNIYVKPSGGTSRRIMPKTMALSVNYLSIYDDEITLETGDLIEGDASVAAVVDYVISGVEKT